MKPWIKAGLVVGVLQILFTLPSLSIFYLPLEIGATISYIACCLFTLLYLLPGILDVHWSAAGREQRDVMYAGGMSGLLATAISGVATFLLIVIVSITGGMEAYLRETLPAEMEILSQSGLGTIILTVTVIIQTCIGLIFHILTGVIISAVGGLVYLAIKNKRMKAG